MLFATSASTWYPHRAASATLTLPCARSNRTTYRRVICSCIGQPANCDMGVEFSGASATRGSRPLNLKLRRARQEDVAELAALCSEAFPYMGGLPQRLLWGLMSRLLPPRATDNWARQFERALAGKAAAMESHRRLRASGAQTWAAGALLDAQVTSERQYLQRNYIRRGFHCLVASDADSGTLLGTLAASLARPQALLPPPFPTNAPLQLYLSNVVVQEDARRQGVAKALLAASERLASRWSYDSLWLHVEADNTPAVELYRSCGYTTVRRDPKWIPGSALLMTKRIQPAQWRRELSTAAGAAAAASAAGAGQGGQAAAGATRSSRGRTMVREGDAARVGGSKREGDGVFVWEVAVGGSTNVQSPAPLQSPPPPQAPQQPQQQLEEED